MLELEFSVEVTDDRLDVAAVISPKGDVPLIAAMRAPYFQEDNGLLYVSAGRTDGDLHLLLGDPVPPSNEDIMQTQSAYYRVLLPGDRFEEEFSLPRPLRESSPYFPNLDEEGIKYRSLMPIKAIMLSVDWALKDDVTGHLPVEGADDMFQLWYSNRQTERRKIAAPDHLTLEVRDDDFERF